MQNVNEEKQVAYYAIIPATIRYDERLKYAERLLYGEITALIGKEGYCFATNSYFANLYNVIPGTISRWISHLSKLGYINVELIKNDKKEITERRIYITDISCRKIVQDTYKQNSTYPYKQNKQYPMSQKAKDIKIDRFFYLIINNNKSELKKEFKEIQIYQEFYELLIKFEFNYTEEILKTFRDENIEKLKIIIYTLKEMFFKNKRLLQKATRENFLDVYENCKSFENSYKNTENEIRNFFDYYYTSLVRKLEAK